MIGYYQATSASAKQVDVELGQGFLAFFDGSNKHHVKSSEIIEVHYPAKNQAFIILSSGSILIKSPNIRGNLKHHLGLFNEQIPRSEKFLKRGVWPLIIVGSFLITLLALFYFFILPWIADRAAMNFPKSQEIALGEALKKHYLLSERVDTQKTRLLNEFVSNLDLGTDYPSDYTVVDADIVNAYALPGGPIVIYSGIIRKMQSPEELVGILAHERSHVLRHHSTRSIFQNLSGVLLMNVLLGDASSMIQLIAQQGQQLNQLAYSRELELEADREGLVLMIKNSINPTGMLTLLEKLNAESKGSTMPEFLSSHPLPDSRIDALKKLINEQQGFKTDKHLDSIWMKLKMPADF